MVTKSKLNNEVLLSETLARKLNVQLGEKITSYFQSKVSSGAPNTRYFKVVGFYETGFPDFDTAYMFADVRHLQRINKWNSDEFGAVEVFLKNDTNVFIL
mgnify:FL=1